MEEEAGSETNKQILLTQAPPKPLSEEKKPSEEKTHLLMNSNVLDESFF